MFIRTYARVLGTATLMICLHASAGEKTHFHIEQISVNGSTNVLASSINDRGDIAGAYISGEQGTGFVEKAGQVQLIPYPCQQDLQYCVPIPTAINRNGLVAGYYSTTGEDPGTYGFTWQAGSASLKSTFLVSDLDCAPCGAGSPVLNDRGEIAFSSQGAPGLAQGTYYGQPPSFQLIAGSGVSLSVSGIDEHGTLAGVRFINAEQQQFTFNTHTAKLHTFHPPGAKLAFSVAVNRYGEIAGSFIDGKNVPHAYIRKNGVYTEFPVPGATFTIIVNAINASGRVVGTFIGANGASEFLYNGSTTTLFDIGLANGMAINDQGVMIANVGTNFNYASYRITCHGTGC